MGNTVDVENATWTNTIGAPELIAVWEGPDFDPAQRAFYYGRVIEIPTPRWTAYDAKKFGVNMPKEVPMTTIETRLHRRSVYGRRMIQTGLQDVHDKDHYMIPRPILIILFILSSHKHDNKVIHTGLLDVHDVIQS